MCEELLKGKHLFSHSSHYVWRDSICSHYFLPNCELVFLSEIRHFCVVLCFLLVCVRSSVTESWCHITFVPQSGFTENLNQMTGGWFSGWCQWNFCLILSIQSWKLKYRTKLVQKVHSFKSRLCNFLPWNNLQIASESFLMLQYVVTGVWCLCLSHSVPPSQISNHTKPLTDQI